MQRLEVSGEVRPIYGSLGVKRLTETLIISRSNKVPLPFRFHDKYFVLIFLLSNACSLSHSTNYR